MPQGIRHGYAFGFLNAFSYQIAAGAPVILYAKSLGASSTVLGIVASMLPLLSFLQLPAAHWLPKVGYRKFMLGGWGLRTIMLFALAGVPLLGFVDDASKIALVLLTLFIFALIRGISSGAWMPWITQLLPAERRGEYLSREQLAAHGGSLAALGIGALMLQTLPHPLRYSSVFLFSAIFAVLSLLALRRMPDIDAEESRRTSGHPVPWRAIITYPPFYKLLVFTVIWSAVVGSLPVFTMSFTKEVLGFGDGTVVALSLLGFVGALLTLPLSAKFLDRTGSKFLLRGTTLLAALLAGCWASVAAHEGVGTAILVGTINLFFGVAGANFAVANARLAMHVMPAMGRNHFFALFTVVACLASGLAPILSGMALDALRSVHGHIGSFEVNRFSLYFGFSALLLLANCACVSWLTEGRDGELTRRDYAILGSLKRLGRLLQK